MIWYPFPPSAPPPHQYEQQVSISFVFYINWDPPGYPLSIMTMSSRAQWIWHYFIITMCGIKVWKGNENLRSVYRNRFSKFWAVSSILGLFMFQKGSLSLIRDENFFLWIGQMGYQKICLFSYYFQNLHITLVKSAPKKSFSQKTILLLENLPDSKKNFFKTRSELLCWGALKSFFFSKTITDKL